MRTARALTVFPGGGGVGVMRGVGGPLLGPPLGGRVVRRGQGDGSS